jgi:hypothetical protein
LLATETDSSAYDHNGDALKKTTYVPFVYTLEEDFASADADVAAILKKYGATYEYTATETADKSSFTNITSKYEGGKLVYYIPAQGSTPAGDKGKAVVTNRLVVVDITVLKVDDKGRPLDSAVFTLQKKEGTYQNIKREEELA